MKPRIEAEVLTVRTWSKNYAPIFLRVQWRISCPCTPLRYLAAVSTWETALEIALLHGRTFHAPNT